MEKGWIALDIDGTVTDGTEPMSHATAWYLGQLQAQGWQLMFITGRTFSFAHRALKNLAFPYLLAVQNGSDIISMPESKVIDQRYLESDAVLRVENAYRGQEEDFLIYAGYEHGDFCYYRPKHFSPGFHEYLKKIMALAPEPWKALTSFHELEGKRFPLIKCLGPEEGMLLIEAKLRSIPGLEVVAIRDPFRPNLHLALVTDREATKGHALERAISKLGAGKKRGRIIAAGDDRNDLSMLAKADIRIVMGTAPDEVKKEADIIAMSSKEDGIIAALKEATGV